MVRDTESNEVQPASAPATLGGDANGASESEKKHKELEEEENEQEEDPEDEIDDEDEDDLAERFTEVRRQRCCSANHSVCSCSRTRCSHHFL